MKKLLAIIVLGLLTGCMSAQNQEKFNKRMSDQQERYRMASQEQMELAEKNISKLGQKGIDIVYINRNFWTVFDFNHAASACQQKQKFYFFFPHTNELHYQRLGFRPKGGIAYCSAKNLSEDPVYGNTAYTSRGGYWNVRYTNIRTYKTYGGYENSTNYDPGLAKSIQQNIKPKLNNEDLLAKVRKTCASFGYKKGTEKFADCMKELYVKQTTPVRNTIIQRNTGSPKKTKRKIDPTVWKDLDNISQGILRDGKSVGEALRDVNK